MKTRYRRPGGLLCAAIMAVIPGEPGVAQNPLAPEVVVEREIVRQHPGHQPFENTGAVRAMAPDQERLPIYHCKKVAGNLRLSGKVDDPLWEQATPIALTDAETGEPGRFATTVRVLYNDDFLYVAFECEDDYVWGTETERDGPIWNEECVEVFVNPAGSAHQYYEINVSPKGVVFDACLINSRTLENPDGPFMPLTELDLKALQTAVHVEGRLDEPGQARGWSAEFAFPIAELWGAPNVPPKPGDVWRVNFYRIDSPRKDQREHYAWSKTDIIAFHLPWKFGFLRFE